MKHIDNIIEDSQKNRSSKAKPDPVIFEINDNRREYEYSGHSYVDPALSFIESLGFTVKCKDHHFVGRTTHVDISINDRNLSLYIGSASYMSRNGFTREEAVRKPINRYVAIKMNYTTDNILVKIPINKEIDGNKLRKRINEALDNLAAKGKEIAEKIKYDRDTHKAICTYFLPRPEINNFIDHIYLHCGSMTFSMKDSSSITLNPDGSLASANFYINPITSKHHLSTFDKGIQSRIGNFKLICSFLLSVPKMPDEWIQWASDKYNRYFYPKTMSDKR